jgi:hypothetical protein
MQSEWQNGQNGKQGGLHDGRPRRTQSGIGGGNQPRMRQWQAKRAAPWPAQRHIGCGTNAAAKIHFLHHISESEAVRFLNGGGGEISELAAVRFLNRRLDISE